MCGFIGTGSYIQIPPQYILKWTKKGDSLEVSAPTEAEAEALMEWLKAKAGW